MRFIGLGSGQYSVYKSKLLRHFIRIVEVNLFQKTFGLRFMEVLIVISDYRGNFSRLKCEFQKRFGLTGGFGLSGFSVYRGLTVLTWTY